MSNSRKSALRGTATEREATRELFEFDWNGATYSLLPATEIPAGVFRKVARMDNELEAMFTIIEAVADEDALSALDEMPLAEFGEVFKRWQEHSGAGLGE
jgi:hypothetical protein